MSTLGRSAAKKKKKESSLIVTSSDDSNLVQVLEKAMTDGESVLQK